MLVRETQADILLPQIRVGEEFALPPVDLVMPRYPGRIISEIDEVPGEINTAGNRRDCPLGAQVPTNLSCSLRESIGGETTVRLSWTNNGIYDAVRVYRDGCMIDEIGGSSRSYIDSSDVGSVPLFGSVDEHTYTVRGILNESISIHSLSCTVSLPPESPPFRRGDFDGSGAVDLTVPILNLTFQFLGTVDVLCEDAADTDDSGVVDLTDPIQNLTFQFLGTFQIPAPGACACGEDPTDDALGCDSPQSGCE